MGDERGTVEAIVAMPELRSILYLTTRGIPFDVAMSLTDLERSAWQIILGELDGGRFDFSAWRWIEKD